MSEAPACGCGRSPTGKCIGWHKLTEEEFVAKKKAYEARQAAKADVPASRLLDHEIVLWPTIVSASSLEQVPAIFLPGRLPYRLSSGARRRVAKIVTPIRPAHPATLK